MADAQTLDHETIVARVLEAALAIGRHLGSSDTAKSEHPLNVACEMLGRAAGAEVSVFRDVRPDHTTHFVAGWASTAILGAGKPPLRLRPDLVFDEPILTRSADEMPIETPPAARINEWQDEVPLQPMMLFCPVRNAAETVGYVCLVGAANAPWTPAAVNAICLACSMIGQFQLRVWSEQAHRRRATLRSFIATTAQQFFELRPGEDAAAIDAVLPKLGELLDAKSLSLWTLNYSQQMAERICRWSRDGNPPLEPLLVEVSNSPVGFANLQEIQIIDEPRTGQVLALVPGFFGPQKTRLILAAGRDGDGSWTSAELLPLSSFADIVATLRERLTNLARLEATFNLSPLGISLRNPEGKLIECNQAFLDFIGASCREDVPPTVTDILDLSQLEPTTNLRPLGAQAGKSRELPYRRLDNSVVWGRTSVVEIGSENDPLFLAHIEDVTLQRRAMAVITAQATTDSVTGAANRHALNELLEELLAGPAANLGDPENPVDEVEGYSCTVILVDLDDFKLVNDTYGHVAGDRILVEVAARLQELVSGNDMVARYGGDEFVVVIAQPASDEAVSFRVREVHESFRSPIMLDGVAVDLHACMGVATALPDDSPDTLLGRADNAMYAHKFDRRHQRRAAADAGRPNPHLDRRVATTPRRSTPETINLRSVDSTLALKDGLQTGQIGFWGQPIMTSRGGTALGVELLARWTMPNGEVLLPRDFIGLAEKSGLVVEIGRQALVTAAEIFDRWAGQPDLENLGVNVNISPIHLLRGLLDDVHAIVPRLPPESQLGLEFTETSLARGLTTHLTDLRNLEDSGVRVIIDDFGIGYSSLSRLQRFPAANLKLDKSFITNIVSDDRERRFFNSITRTLSSAGYPVTVEGVETADQLELVQKSSAFAVQGFHFCRPLPLDDLEEFLRESSQRARLAAH